jgi:hypothetical protein
LVVTAVTTALDWLELRELLLPVPQDMRLYLAEFADFTDGEVTLTGDRR